MVPSQQPSVDRFGLLVELLLTSSSAPIDESSPRHHQPLDELADMDFLELSSEATSCEVFLEQFVVALLYFALYGEE